MKKNSNRISRVFLLGIVVGIIPTLAIAATTITPITTGGSNSQFASCPFLTTYMKLGGQNSTIEVAKLQAFLKVREKLNVEITGTYDDQTFAAVEIFQRKYLRDVMGPWGASRSSGTVYITTQKKINQLACAQPLSLNASDLAIIEAYKAKVASGEISVSAEIGSATTSTDLVSATSTDNNIDSVAAVGEASILQRFWAFIIDLFR